MTIPAEMPVTIEAYAYDKTDANTPITRVVIHDEEFPVGVNSAEDIAHFFAGSGPGTSAHYTVDPDSVEHCVPENRIAYHAPPNRGSVGIEHDGYARFTAAEWALPGSTATLKRSAILTAGICLRYNIPVVFINSADLLSGKSGITFHREVSNAWNESNHQDPGVNFPIAQYIAWVKEAQAAFVAVPKGKSPLLTQGMTNSKVADVQRALDSLNNHTAKLDGNGVFGAETFRVLNIFQQHRGIPVTGTVTPITWAALRVVAHPKK